MTGTAFKKNSLRKTFKSTYLQEVASDIQEPKSITLLHIFTAWIRKKREDPPTIEEILRNENYREEMKQKVKDVSEKDKLLQAKEYEQGLIAEPSHTQVKGHASAPYYGKKEPSQDPTSTANTFQPGAWMPPGSGSNQNK
ncbi:NADH dehydrogenase [ubiquinone] 1 alpha subcomplex assembly factor 2 isoform X3 [Oenanthe melanoleuca]|uniref:NADH dehydrogenase [ubiquinone] 1 alpha subcomplex assembly factor 2 isoform X3 n=1 Tax=Oenanthe melanoleuca TaxID=2939378 RepID=UPI0024C1A680|nr:NADH dehydrogenase [ubiquinone] 1 alpha subcomplex assembly factor 2 isoform X3 [Oenanthe melanoleuca]XP_056369739.1 NADH dehydrogenase [ubiquinone] 1 alpha subcomplex assembly factor 2 isoform X3 [Oenanthe melanoleuca]XP_056369740.1 NADH dehydrogenase [ubiquinone] 1 alpha subcomplex assembly factor 2 isoform X3 [Oenanthe melanoleuca]